MDGSSLHNLCHLHRGRLSIVPVELGKNWERIDVKKSKFSNRFTVSIVFHYIFKAFVTVFFLNSIITYTFLEQILRDQMIL